MIKEFVARSLATYHQALRERGLAPSHNVSYEFAVDLFFRTRKNKSDQYIEWRFSFDGGEADCGEVPANPLDILPKVARIGQVGYDCYLRLVQDATDGPTLEHIHFREQDGELFVQEGSDEEREIKIDDDASQEIIRKIVDLYANGI